MISLLAAAALAAATCPGAGERMCAPLPLLKPAPPEYAAAWCAGWNDAAHASAINARHFSLMIAPSRNAKGASLQMLKIISDAVPRWVVVPPVSGQINDYTRGLTFTCTVR